MNRKRLDDAADDDAAAGLVVKDGFGLNDLRDIFACRLVFLVGDRYCSVAEVPSTLSEHCNTAHRFKSIQRASSDARCKSE